MTIPALSSTQSPWPPTVSDALHQALAAAREGALLVVASAPLPPAPLETLLEACPGEDAVLWAPPEGPTFSAIGAAEVIVGQGPMRFDEVRRRADALFAGVAAAATEGPTAPRCFGGFSFRPGSAGGDPWGDFGDARFVLPRFTYAVAGERAWLSLTARPEEIASEPRRRALLATAEHLAAAVRSAASRRVGRAIESRRVVSRRVDTPPVAWSELVQKARDCIARGEFEKVVVARRTLLECEEPIAPADVLSVLAGSTDRCTRFAFRFGRATFLGATPELLVRKSGLDVESEALAGSNRSGDPSGAGDLLSSQKERSEHTPVLREIVRALAPLCSSLEHPDAPQIRALKHILHLWTPVRGRLRAPAHALDLVARLHPTPAVGGVPASAALDFLAREEPLERGWYASPVGWFDAAGNGEFGVALRSGALVGGRAHLYAGGGIVQDSDPESEYAETRLKLAAMEAALRVAP